MGMPDVHEPGVFLAQMWLPILLAIYITQTFLKSARMRLRTGRWGPGPLSRALAAIRREAER